MWEKKLEWNRHSFEEVYNMNSTGIDLLIYYINSFYRLKMEYLW